MPFVIDMSQKNKDCATAKGATISSPWTYFQGKSDQDMPAENTSPRLEVSESVGKNE